MIPGGGGSPYFLPNHHHQQLFHAALDGMDVGAALIGGAEPAVSESDTRCHALLCNLSVLKDKVHQLQPLVGLAVAHDGPGPVAAASEASAVIQEIISAASSIMYAFQQLCSHGAPSANAAAQGDGSIAAVGHAKNGIAAIADSGCVAQAAVVMDHAVIQQWQNHHGGYDQYHIHSKTTTVASSSPATGMAEEEAGTGTIIELDAAELLAKYTHYCQVCGKGFKRDANLRMHMRAHGDEYKSSAALANPAKASAATAAGGDAAVAGAGNSSSKRSYYSCPQEGCRWNRKHAKFQPLKSVICAKNHYKRSHCPKMYVCNRCNRKHFSVLSDLRTHEKHCGDDHRWLCSCGTSFSRKDKLIGHLALFAGHQSAVPLDRHANGKRSASSTSVQLGT